MKQYPHILPGGKLIHFVKNGDESTCYISKKNRFHEVVLSSKGQRLFDTTYAAIMPTDGVFISDPSAFFQNHK
jgi:hypothetical protein